MQLASSCCCALHLVHRALGLTAAAAAVSWRGALCQDDTTAQALVLDSTNSCTCCSLRTRALTLTPGKGPGPILTLAVCAALLRWHPPLQLAARAAAAQ